MLSFTNYLTEAGKDPKSSTWHGFDIDETLFAHDHDKLKVHVRDKRTGARVKSLTNQEYNSHKLDPNHEYDYRDFNSSEVFHKTARPIRKMIAKMKAIHKRNKNVEMVTARSDMDDKEHFAKHFAKYGIDIGKIHVHRAGNVDKKGRPAVNKAHVISNLIHKHDYTKMHLYDDSKDNLNHFLALKEKHPNVEFHAHHVEHDPETGHVKVTTTVR